MSRRRGSIRLSLGPLPPRARCRSPGSPDEVIADRRLVITKSVLAYRVVHTKLTVIPLTRALSLARWTERLAAEAPYPAGGPEARLRWSSACPANLTTDPVERIVVVMKDGATREAPLAAVLFDQLARITAWR